MSLPTGDGQAKFSIVYAEMNTHLNGQHDMAVAGHIQLLATDAK